MAPVIRYDGETYYLLNSIHVNEVLINGRKYPVYYKAQIYGKSPQNAGAMYGIDDVLLEIDGEKIFAGRAKWVYVNKKLNEELNHPCKQEIQKTEREIVLVICS